MTKSPKKTSPDSEADSLLNSIGLATVALIICLMISSIYEYKKNNENKEAHEPNKEKLEKVSHSLAP